MPKLWIVKETCVVTPANCFMPHDAIQPKIIPTIPPIKVSMNDSVKNCIFISFSSAPIAFLKPISLVLSVTVVSIMFIIPIPPTTSEIPAIDASKIVNVFVTEDAVFTIDCWFKT